MTYRKAAVILNLFRGLKGSKFLCGSLYMIIILRIYLISWPNFGLAVWLEVLLTVFWISIK